MREYWFVINENTEDRRVLDVCGFRDFSAAEGYAFMLLDREHTPITIFEKITVVWPEEIELPPRDNG